MPKTLVSLFKCPVCGNNKFEETIYAVFTGEATSQEPGLVYQRERQYVCSSCKFVARKEIDHG